MSSTTFQIAVNNDVRIVGELDGSEFTARSVDGATSFVGMRHELFAFLKGALSVPMTSQRLDTDESSRPLQRSLLETLGEVKSISWQPASGPKLIAEILFGDNCISAIRPIDDTTVELTNIHPTEVWRVVCALASSPDA